MVSLFLYRNSIWDKQNPMEAFLSTIHTRLYRVISDKFSSNHLSAASLLARDIKFHAAIIVETCLYKLTPCDLSCHFSSTLSSIQFKSMNVASHFDQCLLYIPHLRAPIIDDWFILLNRIKGNLSGISFAPHKNHDSNKCQTIVDTKGARWFCCATSGYSWGNL